MKTIVLMVSNVFPAYHIKRGISTNFENLIFQKIKKHTLRGNYELWKRRIDQINDGDAVLSLRQWEGKPYKSKQVEIKQLSSCDDIGIQKLTFNASNLSFPVVNRLNINPVELAKNDGLSMFDFENWFYGYDLSKPMAIIHFTGFRY